MNFKRSLRYATGRAMSVWKVAVLMGAIWASVTQAAVLSQKIDLVPPPPQAWHFYDPD